MRGKGGAYNVDLRGDPPWVWYARGDLPPLMAAGRFGDGAVVAASIVCSCRNGRWNDTSNPCPHLDTLFDAIFQWMVPDASSVLWYEGYQVYNDRTRCSDMVTALRDLGYSVSGISTQPITPDLLSGRNIFVIPQFELGDPATGGAPSLLPDEDIQVIKEFVEDGGGLLIMDGADFGGYNYYRVHNKILEAFGFGYGFQDDQVYDNDNPWNRPYEIFAEVDDGTEIGAAYKAVTGGTTVGLYAVCTLAPMGPSVEVQVIPEYQIGSPGAVLGYSIVVENPKSPTAKDLRCVVEVEDTAGWGLTLENDIVLVSVGENRVVPLSVSIPEDAEHCEKDRILVTVTSHEAGVSDNASCIAHAVTATVPDVKVVISPSEGTGAPGTVLNYTVTVTNTGTVSDNYSLTASDNSGWPLTISPSTLAVDPGASTTATLGVVVPVAAESCTRDVITVVVTSAENSKVSDSASCRAHAFGPALKRGIGISVSSDLESGDPGENLIYRIEVKSLGETGDDFHLEITSTKGWESDLSVTSFWMNKAGRSWGKGILLVITIPDNAKEGDSSWVTVNVSGTGYENQVTLKAVVKGEEFAWSLVAVLVAGILMGAGVILITKG